MADIFKLKQAELPSISKDGIVVRSEFDVGYCGVTTIYLFEELEIKLPETIQEGSRAYLEIEGRSWTGGFENPAYALKNSQPFNRGGVTTYIPVGFDDLDIIPTLNGGRFLSLKKLWKEMGTSTSADYYPDRKRTCVYSSDKVEALSKDLGIILQLSGVPHADVRNIQEDIFRKLGYDTNKIVASDAYIFTDKRGKPLPSITALVVHLRNKGKSNEEIGEVLFGKEA